MNILNKLLFIVAFSFISGICVAQNNFNLPCGFDEIHQSLLKNDPVYSKNVKDIDKRIQLFIKDSIAGKFNNQNKLQQRPAVVYTIPIVVHVVHLGESVGVGTNISDAQILGAISGLNDRFRNVIGNSIDVELQFCLASKDPNGNFTTGINRVNGSGIANYSSQGLGIGNQCPGSANEIAIKNLSIWPNTSYYNIWIVNSICNGGYGGYAYYPGAAANVDGAAIIYNFFNYDNATTAHELGHGFNLYHTFTGDNNNTVCPVNGNCSLDGDQCCDTPPHKQGDCGSTNPCTTSGIWNNSRYNYLSYCYLGWPPPSNSYGRFTQDQINRMRATLNFSPRANLLNSQGCGAVSPPLCNNDNSCSPTTISVNTNGNCVTTNCSTINATYQSPDIPFYGATTCTSLYQSGRYDDDVWFSITTTSPNPVTIRVTPTSNTSNFDVVIGLYQGSCSNPTQVTCADLFGVGVTENLNFTPPAGTNNYLVRVFSYGIGSSFAGNFNICAFMSCTLPGLVTVNGGGTFCNSAVLTASGGSGGTIYWQNTTSGGTSTTNSTNPQTVTSSGTYYFRANNSCGWGSEGSATVTIINSVPGVVTVTGGGTSCNSAILTASGGSGGTIYWQGTNSGGTSTANPTNTQTVTSSGTYYFRAYNICGWGAEGSATVTITTLPGAVTVNGGGTFCNSAVLTATGGSGGTIYWQGTTNNGTSTAVASTSQTVTSSGTYYFRAFNSCGWGPQGSATVTIINSVPTAVTASGGGTFCNSAILTASGGIGGTIYWQGTNSGGTSTANPTNTQTVTSSGTYYFRAYNICGWGAEGSATVTITSIPGAVTVSGGGTFCNSAVLTATGGSGGAIYWQGTTSGGTSTSTASTNQTVTSSGTYYFRAFNSCGWGPQGSATVTIINSSPTAVTVSGGGTFCNSAILTASGGLGGTIYWQGTNSGGTSTVNPTNTQTVTSSGTYYFRAYNICGWGAEGSVTVTITSIPGAVTVSGGGTFCNSAVLTATGGSGGTIYWQGTTSGGTSTSTASTSQTVISSGTYYFRAFNSCGWGPQGSATVTMVTSAPVLQANISSFTRTTTQITANISPGNGTRRIVKINTLENFTAPVNGTDPAANSTYAGIGEQVVMNGNGTSVTINNLTPGTNYCFRVFEANCTGSASVYSVTGTNFQCVKTLSNFGLPSISGIEEFTILPNPNKGIFYVKVKFNSGRDVQFKLHNMLGQIVYQSPTYQITGLQTKDVAVSNIAAGVYLLETIVGSESFRRTVIILR